MATEQSTLGESTGAIDVERVRELIEDCRWTHDEVADELGTDPDRIMTVIHRAGINYSPSSAGANTTGAAKTLWEMDPDELDQYTGGDA